MQSITDTLNKTFNGKRFNLIAFVLIAGVVLIAYSNTFHSAFHFDDNPSIVENQAIKQLTWDSFLSMFSGTRPVVNLSLMLNYQINGLDVVGWHVFNVLFHIMNSYFVYLFIAGMLSLPALSERYGDRARRMALFGALLFGVHPVQTEAVTYIISRTGLLATFFYLAAFLVFIKGARKKKFSYMIASGFLSLCAMESKEWAVTLPAMILLYDFLFLSNRSLKPVLSRWKAYVLVSLPWCLVAYVMSTTKMSGAGFGIVGVNSITPWDYQLTSFNVLWTYVRLLLLPIHQNLDYEYPLAMTLFEFPTLLSFAGHVAVVLVSLWLYSKKKWSLIPFGVAWFYITISPTQSFVPILDKIFEHRVYLPSIGFFIVFIVVFESVLDWIEKKIPRGNRDAVSPAA
jgi:protein O-mannosyl-transferase